MGVDTPNAVLVSAVYDQYNPATTAPGGGSMPYPCVWRKRTHRRPYLPETPVHMPCLWQDLRGDGRHAALDGRNHPLHVVVTVLTLLADGCPIPCAGYLFHPVR